MNIIRDMEWWYWLVTDALLLGSLAGWRWGAWPVMLLTGVQVVHYLVRERRVMAFPVQVRLGYLLLVVLGTVPSLGVIHWLLFAGTTARVTTQYCLLARCMALMPWNRSKPLSATLVWKIITLPPVAGSILDVVASE